MKRCPHCMEPPSWAYARRTSVKRGVECHFFQPALGCTHASKFQSDFPVPRPDQAERESAWDKEADELFKRKTEGWTPEQVARLAKILE